MSSPMQGEAKGTGTEGGQQTIVLTLLKTIHTLPALSSAGDRSTTPPEGLLQQLQWSHKATE